MALVDIQNLTIDANPGQGCKTIVNHVSFAVPEQNITALVGGSGSGKTTTGLAIMRLLSPGLRVVSGRIYFEGQDLLSLPKEALRGYRGKQMAMVFQEPLYAFNPVFRIGSQIEEVLQFHTGLTKGRRQERVEELLRQVEIRDPGRVAQSYPYQLSGGLRQRAMLAQAIAASPKLVIADEPTSNLDVTVQARILMLFKKLRDELGLTVLIITHDLGLVRSLADHIVVLCSGEVVEGGPVGEVLQHPRHSYTQQLLEAAK
ncbi:MAG: ABC transporter ATP-binding protein [Candidatus Omnitrophica bacterium]|nr:ABC transporter ATP-binding protein [Candidatus Omnitrophota bacterium]HPB68626.1 ABC transporter ATP-binding protein [Candidatus Omnitrophota bacterium]